MQKFYLTFGQKSPARNGYFVVTAKDYMTARELVLKEYAKDWANLYLIEDFDPEAFPAGKLGELK